MPIPTVSVVVTDGGVIHASPASDPTIFPCTKTVATATGEAARLLLHPHDLVHVDADTILPGEHEGRVVGLSTMFLAMCGQNLGDTPSLGDRFVHDVVSLAAAIRADTPDQAILPVLAAAVAGTSADTLIAISGCHTHPDRWVGVTSRTGQSGYTTPLGIVAMSSATGWSSRDAWLLLSAWSGRPLIRWGRPGDIPGFRDSTDRDRLANVQMSIVSDVLGHVLCHDPVSRIILPRLIAQPDLLEVTPDVWATPSPWGTAFQFACRHLQPTDAAVDRLCWLDEETLRVYRDRRTPGICEQVESGRRATVSPIPPFSLVVTRLGAVLGTDVAQKAFGVISAMTVGEEEMDETCKMQTVDALIAYTKALSKGTIPPDMDPRMALTCLGSDLSQWANTR